MNQQTGGHPPKLQITRLFPVPAATADRLGKMDTLVEYVIDGRHTFTVRILDENPQPATVEQAVRLDARNKQAVLGKILEQ